MSLNLILGRLVSSVLILKVTLELFIFSHKTVLALVRNFSLREGKIHISRAYGTGIPTPASPWSALFIDRQQNIFDKLSCGNLCKLAHGCLHRRASNHLNLKIRATISPVGSLSTKLCQCVIAIVNAFYDGLWHISPSVLKRKNTLIIPFALLQ